MKKVVDASNTFRGCVFRDCPDLYAFAQQLLTLF